MSAEISGIQTCINWAASSSNEYRQSVAKEAAAELDHLQTVEVGADKLVAAVARMADELAFFREHFPRATKHYARVAALEKGGEQ